MNKTVCVYHSIDLDGYMSAAIVKHYYNLTANSDTKIRGYNNIDFIGFNYGQAIPDLSQYDTVIMVDISFPNEEMLILANKLGVNFIWIDHHQPKINEVSKYLVENKAPTIDGLTTIEGRPVKAACELTWEYFFPFNSIPEIVRLLGRYDSFGHKGTEEERKVLEFQYGARQEIRSYEEAYKFLDIYRIDDKEIINYIWDKGRSIYEYLCSEAKQVYKNGFEVAFDYYTEPYQGNEDGYHRVKFICINKERFNPINFGINYHEDGYDGATCFYYDGVAKLWRFSLYNDNGEIDCSIIAKQYGGGGHKGASGFVLNNEQFINFMRNE